MDWSPYYKRVLALDRQGLSTGEIAALLSEELHEDITRHMVRHALERAEETIAKLEDMPAPDRIPYITKYMQYINGNMHENKDYGIKSNIMKKPKAKVLITSDLHIPFHDEAQITEAINKNIDADVFLGVADIMDCYSLSRFDKSSDIPLVFEIDEALRIIEYLSQNFPWVELLEANHERRAFKSIVRALPESLLFMADVNILERICAPFPNVVVNTDSWFFQFGSGLFCHPEKSSIVELRTAMACYEYFKEWHDAYSFKPWNSLYVAHTHQTGVAYTSNTKVVQMGCLARPMAYAKTSGSMYKHPQSNSYIVGYMDNGVFDVNSTREYVFKLTPY
jgi:hypothetical protein